MDQNKLIEWQENPTLIGKQEVEDLESLLEDFPYYSLGQILLAKGYKNISHYKQEEQIKKASLYCADREWLYHFLHDDTPQKPIQTKPQIEEKPKDKIEEIPVETPVVQEVENEEKPVEEVVSKEEKRVPIVEATPKKQVLKKLDLEAPFKLKKEAAWKVSKKVKDTTPAKLEEDLKPSEMDSKTEEVAKPIPKKRGRPRKTPIAEEEVNKPAPKKRGRPPKVKKEEDQTVDTKAEEEVKPASKKRGRPPKVKKEEKPEEKQEIKAEQKEPTKEEAKVKKSKKLKKKKKKKKVVLDEKDLLDELMRQNISYNLEDYYPDTDEKNTNEKDSKVAEVESEGAQDFFSWLKSTEEEAKPIKKKKEVKKTSEKAPKAHKSLSPIEEFLKNKNSIPKKKVSFFSPVEMAKKSDIIEGDIVSETLAKVYEDQERFSEAILTYEKLILLFPQKETYFASRIENLRKRIDNN